MGGVQRLRAGPDPAAGCAQVPGAAQSCFVLNRSVGYGRRAAALPGRTGFCHPSSTAPSPPSNPLLGCWLPRKASPGGGDPTHQLVLYQVAHHLVVEVLDLGPLDPLLHVFLLGKRRESRVGPRAVGCAAAPLLRPWCWDWSAAGVQESGCWRSPVAPPAQPPCTCSAFRVSSMKICCSFSFTKLMQNCSKPFFCRRTKDEREDGAEQAFAPLTALEGTPKSRDFGCCSRDPSWGCQLLTAPGSIRSPCCGSREGHSPAGFLQQSNTYLEDFKAVDVQHPDAVLLMRLPHSPVDRLRGETGCATAIGNPLHAAAALGTPNPPGPRTSTRKSKTRE